jgi:hypothetical protein
MGKSCATACSELANVLKKASTLAGYHSPFFLDDINYSHLTTTRR